LHAASKKIQYGSINGNKKRKEDVSAVMIDQGRMPGQVSPYLNHPHQPIYPYQYGEASQALYHPPSTPYHVYNTHANYYQY